MDDIQHSNGGSSYTYSGSQKSPYRAEADVAQTEDYLMLNPHRRPPGFRNFLKELRHMWMCDVETSDSLRKYVRTLTWRQVLSRIFLDLLYFGSGLLAAIGICLELPGNIWAANGHSLWQIIKKLFKREIVRAGLDRLDVYNDKFPFRRQGELVIPRKDEDASYHTLIGQLDPRTHLYVDKSAYGKAHSDDATPTIFPGTDAGARATGDVCVMASKLAYENKAVVEQVVTNDWHVRSISTLNL